MDLYRQMGDELRDLFKDLFHPEKKEETLAKMEAILKTASKIGGPLFLEAKELNADVVNYLKNPKDKGLVSRLKREALKLEDQTREI